MNKLAAEKGTSLPQQPHGGKLVNQVLTGEEQKKAMEKAKTLPTIVVDMEAVITLEMIATGVLSPIDGFMDELYYTSLLMVGRLKYGIIWPVLFCFAPFAELNKGVIQSIKVGDEFVLADKTKEPVAILKLTDIFNYDRVFRAEHLFGITDRNHPGVDSIYRRMGDLALAGPIQLLRRLDWGPFESI